MSMNNKMNKEEFEKIQRHTIQALAKKLIGEYSEAVEGRAEEKVYDYLVNKGMQISHSCYDIDLEPSGSYDQDKVAALLSLRTNYSIWSDFLKRFTTSIGHRDASYFFEPDNIRYGNVVENSVGDGNGDPLSEEVLKTIREATKEKLGMMRTVQFRESNKPILTIVHVDQDSLTLTFGKEIGLRPLKRSSPVTHIIEFAIKRSNVTPMILMKAEIWERLSSVASSFGFKGSFEGKKKDAQRQSLNRYFKLANKSLQGLFPSLGSHVAFSSVDADIDTIIFKM